MPTQGIKVETDTLTQLAGNYRTLAEEYKTCCDNLEKKLKEYEVCWKGSFAEDFDDEIDNLKKERTKVYDNCINLATFLDEAVQLYIQVDRNLIPKENVNSNDYPDGVEVSNHIEAGQVLDDIWRDWADYSPNGFTNINKKGNCTWYADHRWSQLNPDYPLRFTDGSKNAKNWDERIDKNYFDVNSTSDPNNIKSNAIAVSEQGTYGHVAYIEKVENGMVYFTEDGESYTRPHTWEKDANGNWVGPKVQCCTLEQFKAKFGKIITAKK